MSDAPRDLPAERRPPPRGDRRFTAPEVDEILRRAARSEERGGLPAPHDPTLADLMHAAEEVGLDPGAVRRAAAVEPWRGAGVTGAVFGAPDRRELAAFLEGASLPRARDALVRAAERVLRRRGEVLESDSARFVWKEDHVVGRTTVTLADTGEGTEVRVAADRAGHFFLGWFGALAGWAVGANVLMAALGISFPGVGTALGSLLVAPFMVARPFWSAADRRLRARLEEAVLELARVAEDGDGGGEGDAPPPDPRKPTG